MVVAAPVLDQRLRAGQTVDTNVPGGLGYTYPNPVQVKDKLWLFWRGGAWNPTFSYTEDGIPLGAGPRARLLRPRAAAVREVRRRRGPPHPRHLHRRSPGELEEQPALHALREPASSTRWAGPARHAGPGAAAHLEARPHLQLLRPGRARVGARHRAHRRGPPAGRLHAPGRQPRHLLLRLPQRHEVDQPQDRRGRAPAARPSTPAARRSTTRTRAIVYLSRTIGRWNQVEQWFTPDEGRTWTHPPAHRRPNGYAIRPVTPRGLRDANRILYVWGDERTIGFTNYMTRIHALDF